MTAQDDRFSCLRMSDFEVNGTTLAASYAALIAVNYGAGKGLLGGKTNRELSAAYPTEVTPRGLTFAIWG